MSKENSVKSIGPLKVLSLSAVESIVKKFLNQYMVERSYEGQNEETVPV
jgi:hypothetical protein